MKTKKTALPLIILILVLAITLPRIFFRPNNKPHLKDDGTVYYKLSQEHDSFLYKINDSIAFEVSIVPTMKALSTIVCAYKTVNGIEGFVLGKNKKLKELFYPTSIKNDWVYTSYALKGKPYSINIKTGEQIVSESLDGKVNNTEFYKSNFSRGKSFEDDYVLKNFEYINTYKNSGLELIIAGAIISVIVFIWLVIAFITDHKKNNNKI